MTRQLGPEEMQILRETSEWAGRYAIYWLLFTISIFIGAHLLFEYLGADANTRILAFILLATLVLVNAVWHAAGAVAARIELRRFQRRN